MRIRDPFDSFRGIRSPFGRRRSGFSPDSLFANGEQGAWYDPSDLTTLYQDSAGTTAVTADGDPVGYMGDKSGNGNHATQAISAARPVYRTDGTLHWLKGDGVDDSTDSPGVDYSVPEFWMWCAGSIADNEIAISLQGADFQYLRIDGYKVFARPNTGSYNENILNISAWTSPTVWTIRARQSDRSITAYRDGAELGSFVLPGTDWWPSTMKLNLHAAQRKTAESNSNIYSAGTLVGSMSGAERQKLEAHLASKAGVTL